jgi:hypothetical protein
MGQRESKRERTPMGLENVSTGQITADYHTPILTGIKSVSVRNGEQGCFTGGFG